MCIDRDCGECRILTQANARRANRGAEGFALFWVVVFLMAGGAAWILHAVEAIAMCIGLVILGIVAGYIAVRVWLAKHRRLTAPAQGLSLMPYQAAPGRLAVPQQQAAALPAADGGQHLHLHLPDSIGADELARLLRRDQ